MMMALWRAKQATIYTSNSISDIDDDTSLLEQLSSEVDWSGEVKSIEISGAEADTEPVYLFGSTDGGQQNAEIEEQNMTQREFTGTLIYKDEDAAELATSEATSVGDTDFNRIQGDGTRSKKAILIHFTDGTNNAHVLLNNAYFTKMGDISLDAEGHAEQEVTAKCLAKDYFEESDYN